MSASIIMGIAGLISSALPSFWGLISEAKSAEDAARRSAESLEASKLSALGTPKGPKYLYSRVSVLGIVIMIWESIPHNST